MSKWGYFNEKWVIALTRRFTTTMAEETTDIQESQTPDEKETQENQKTSTVEDAPDSQTEGGDDAKEQEDFYAKELKRLQGVEAEKKKLEEELLEKERQVELKNRALQAEKKKVKPELTDRDALKDELLLEMRLERELSELPDAQRKVVLHHLQNSIRRTGDVKTDIQRAIAVSNAGRMQELLQQQQAADAADDLGASSMIAGGQNGQRGSNRTQSQARKIAEQWAKEMKNPPKDLLKHLGNYLPN